jgi:hypothetical protein
MSGAAAPCALHYDLAANGFAYSWWPLAGLGGIVAVYLLYRVYKEVAPFWQKPLWGLIGACCAIIAFSMYLPAKAYFAYRHALSSVQSGNAEKTEGVVAEYIAITAGQNNRESFLVAAKRFSYDPNAITIGFKETQASRSPIHNGIRVRITSVDATIVRLEVCRNSETEG